MQFLVEILLDVVFWGGGVVLFLTGEVLLWIFTFGSHRIRWYEVQDHNITWPPTLLGLAFFMGLGAIVYWLLQ